MTTQTRFLFFFISIIGLNACRYQAPATIENNRLFSLLPASYTGIDFINEIEYTEEFNPYTYRNFFNGGGVGIGDLNNDGLPDIFFCGNMRDNRLYLNRGEFKFDDITELAGVASTGVWSTGVSFADVNGDGKLDIYVCKSGAPGGENRHNELFINQGNDENGIPRFAEKARDWGIADLGLSTHAAFFDFDKDGDLDCYLLNNSFRPVGGYDLRRNQREIRDTLGGNKLYRNDGDHFTDISAPAGIYGSDIGFGLGVTIGDVNRDGWQDIFVSNDFFEKDYLYLNNQDGTFTECLETYIQEISLGSMGADMADLNNDGLPEIFVTEMLPEDDARMKTKTRFENWDKYEANLNNGYYRQFTRNVLQLNLGRMDNKGSYFSEIGRLAGVHATDWSWGALLFDADNDGRKDIFVANGIFKDLTDQDYINFYSNDPEIIASIRNKEPNAILKLIELIPSERLPNYFFANRTDAATGQFYFENKAAEWGLETPSFSNGSAYGDLDNDGDLDLVVNNCNMSPFVYRNNTEVQHPNHNWLVVSVKGTDKNPFGLGTQVTLYRDQQLFYQELAPMRGFESCVDHRLHFGLGTLTGIDSLTAVFPNNKKITLTNVAVNQLLTLEAGSATGQPDPLPHAAMADQLFKPSALRIYPDYVHQENEFVDFDRDHLLFNMLSTEGPKMAAGDVNGDGRTDFFIGGAKGYEGRIFLQQKDGSFRQSEQGLIAYEQGSEDTGCLFFDADGDGDLDLYVCGGGNEFLAEDPALRDRLFINDGKGNFTNVSPQRLPAGQFESTSCVDAVDFDHDGDLDLFVGVRLYPGIYGAPMNGYILRNDGRGIFQNATREIAPELTNLGMITDAQWLDVDNDQDPDLVIVGEWMPVTVFINNQGFFSKITIPNSAGLWLSIASGDLDGDGDPDLVLGNHGTNSRLRAAPGQPLRMYVNDFDLNGTAEQLICVYNGGESYPLALRHDLVSQLPELKKKYLKYERYKNQTVADIFTPEQIESGLSLAVDLTESVIAINQGDGRFELTPLPFEAQVSPVYQVLVHDFDQDGRQDILLGGNLHRAKPETGIYAASYGLYLRGQGDGRFLPVSPQASGFFVNGEIRDMILLENTEAKRVLVARNGDGLLSFDY